MKIEINQVMLSLRAQNKTPSLALVRSKLSTPVPMPELIRAISDWKTHGDKILKIDPTPHEQILVNHDDELNTLKTEIEQLKLRVNALEQLLISQQKNLSVKASLPKT